MKFEREIEVNASVRKLKEYDFEFSPEEVKKGMDSTYEEPYLFKKDNNVWELYKNPDGILRANLHAGYVGFIEKEVK